VSVLSKFSHTLCLGLIPAPTTTDWLSLCSYKQALHGAKAARALAAEHSLPFTRPDDFFAEMVKTDAHMERIRQRLLDESAGIAKSEARRREREGKKIGKQVQLEKLKERERSKKDMEERLKGLKRSASSLSHHSSLFTLL
jgi:rRNA-processing protein EBP2